MHAQCTCLCQLLAIMYGATKCKQTQETATTNTNTNTSAKLGKARTTASTLDSEKARGCFVPLILSWCCAAQTATVQLLQYSGASFYSPHSRFLMVWPRKYEANVSLLSSHHSTQGRFFLPWYWFLMTWLLHLSRTFVPWFSFFYLAGTYYCCVVLIWRQ